MPTPQGTEMAQKKYVYLTGLIALQGFCAIFFAGDAVHDFLFERGAHWALAGVLGAVIGAVWNFSLSSFFTWRRTPISR